MRLLRYWYYAVLFPLLSLLFIPPFRADDLIYHLLVPARIVRSGFFFDPHNINTNLPMLFEVPLIVTEWLGWVSPFVLNLAVLAGLLWAYQRVALRRFGVAPGLAALGALCLAYVPVVVELLSSCYVELFLTLVIVSAFSQYLKFRECRERPGPWWGCMALLGVACGTKYFGLIYLAYVAAIEFFSWQGSRRRYYGGLTLALAIAAPWYVKNWVLTGNPVFPLLNSLFASPYLSAARAFQFGHLAANYHDGRGIVDFVLLLPKLVAGYQPAAHVGRLGFGGAIGLFLLLSLAGLRFRTARERIVSGLFAGYGLFWALTSQQVRFLLPAAVLISLQGLGVVSALWERRRWALWLMFGAVMLQNLAINGWQLRRDRIDRLLSGRMSREQFLGYHLPVSYAMAREINRTLDPARHRVLTIGNYGRDYYFTVPTLSHTYYDTEYLDRAFRADSVDAAVFEAFVRAAGVTHLLMNWQYYHSVHGASGLVDIEALRGYLRRHGRVVLERGAVQLLWLVAAGER